MVEFDMSISSEIEDISKRIYSWYKSGIKTLSITTAPLNTNIVFRDIIRHFISNNKKILYILGEGKEEKYLLGNILQEGRSITHCKLEKGTGECDINFVNYKNISHIKGSYSLTIIDDISTFTTLTKDDLRSVYNTAIKMSERIIVYSIEDITILGDKIEYTPLLYKKPFIEPRVISTRIDLNKDMPYILYDYIKWFNKNKRKVIVYVPNGTALDNVYDYYINKLKLNKTLVRKISVNDKKKDLKSVLKIKDKAIFIITDFKEISIGDSNVTNAIVMFADSSEYSYRQLIYICGQITKGSDNSSEVLFVSKDVTEVIDKVRDTSRDYNKVLWKKRLERFSAY